MTLTISEKRVIQAMRKLNRWATANDIAKKAEMSWNTVSDALNELEQRAIVIGDIRGTKIYWKLNIH